MAGLAAAAGAGRRNVNLCFSQPRQHGLALDAHLAEVQHLGHRVFRAVELHLRKSFQAVPQTLVQGLHSGVTALHGLGKTGGGCGKTHGVGQVFGARAQAALLLTAEVRRPERLHQTVRKVERTNALGSVDLVAAHRQGVDVRQLDGHTHPRLHCVHMDNGAAVAALDLGGKAFHIVAGAHLVVHHHAGHEDGVLVHMLQHFVDIQCAVRAGLDHRDIVALLRQLFQRALDAGVLKAGHHDALAESAGAHRAQQGQIVALAAAGGKVQLLWLAAQCTGHSGTGGVQRFLAAGTGAVQAGRVCPVFPHGLVDDIRHLGSHHGGSGVIQIMQFRVLQHKRDSCFLFL